MASNVIFIKQNIKHLFMSQVHSGASGFSIGKDELYCYHVLLCKISQNMMNIKKNAYIAITQGSPCVV